MKWIYLIFVLVLTGCGDDRVKSEISKLEKQYSARFRQLGDEIGPALINQCVQFYGEDEIYLIEKNPNFTGGAHLCKTVQTCDFRDSSKCVISKDCGKWIPFKDLVLSFGLSITLTKCAKGVGK